MWWSNVNIEEIEKDFNSGMLKKDIVTKHHITLNQLNYQIRKNKWKTRKPKGTKGNKGGHGTKNNKNAEVTGAYSKFNGCFSDEELELFNEPIKGKKDILKEEIRICKIREFRILNKIKELNCTFVCTAHTGILTREEANELIKESFAFMLTHQEHIIDTLKKAEKPMALHEIVKELHGKYYQVYEMAYQIHATTHAQCQYLKAKGILKRVPHNGKLLWSIK